MVAVVVSGLIGHLEQPFAEVVTLGDWGLKVPMTLQGKIDHLCFTSL